MQSLDELYSALSTIGHHRRGDLSVKVKSQVLRCIYRFVERPEDELLLKLARVIFCVSF